jgi:hypothetical protein
MDRAGHALLFQEAVHDEERSFMVLVINQGEQSEV